MQPRYSTSRRQLWLSFWFGWATIIAIVASGLTGSPRAVELAPVVIPSMMLLIAAMLGIHRFSGSLDFAASSAANASALPNSYNPRDDPAGDQVGT